MAEPAPKEIQDAFTRGAITALAIAADIIEQANERWLASEVATFLRKLAVDERLRLLQLGAADADRRALEGLLREALAFVPGTAPDLQQRIETALAVKHPAWPSPRRVR